MANRNQRVKLKGGISKYENATTGVPQRTILGPFFFVLYVNDLSKSMPNDIIISYADDTAAILTDDTRESWN